MIGDGYNPLLAPDIIPQHFYEQPHAPQLEEQQNTASHKSPSHRNFMRLPSTQRGAFPGALERYLLGNKMLAQRMAEEDENRSQQKNACAHLLLTGLLPGTSEQDLAAQFSPFGEVLLAAVMRRINSPTNWRCRGFGFVVIDGLQAGEQAIQAFKDGPITVKMSANVVRPGRGIVVRNMPAELSDNDHVAFFEQFGPLHVLQVRCAKRRFSRLFNDVTLWYESKKDARKAVKSVHGLSSLTLPDKELVIPLAMPLFVKFVDSLWPSDDDDKQLGNSSHSGTQHFNCSDGERQGSTAGVFERKMNHCTQQKSPARTINSNSTAHASPRIKTGTNQDVVGTGLVPVEGHLLSNQFANFLAAPYHVQPQYIVPTTYLHATHIPLVSYFTPSRFLEATPLYTAQ